jgi:hypothetical protein
VNKFKAVAILAMVFSSSAFACQPPRDMPSDPQAAQEYWNRARTAWEKHVVKGAPTLLVARVALTADPKAAPISPDDPTQAALAPIKELRGAVEKRGVIANHWCDDFKVSVANNGVYLLVMSGQRILLAVPLVAGQERAGVGAFFERISEPNPWP